MDDIRATIRRAQSGDEQAFREIMENYRDAVYRYIHSILNNNEDAEDVLQEVFLKAFRSLSRFMIEYSFYKWLMKIACNTCIDFMRKKKLPTVSIRRSSVNCDEDDYEIEIADPLGDPDTVYKQHETREKLDKEIHLLPEIYRDLIIMRFFEQLSYEEIARRLTIPEGTVKTRIFRAREMLKEKFAGWY